MKRKLSLLLAMVLAMTMVMGISVTAEPGLPEGCPESVPSCTHPEVFDGTLLIYVYGFTDDGKVKVVMYSRDTGMWCSIGEKEYATFEDDPTLNKLYHYNSDFKLCFCEEPSPTPTPTPTPTPKKESKKEKEQKEGISYLEYLAMLAANESDKEVAVEKELRAANAAVDKDTFKSEAPAKTIMSTDTMGADKFLDLKIHAADERTKLNQQFLCNTLVRPNAQILLTENVYSRRDLSIAENGSLQTLTWNNLPKNQPGPVYAVVYNQKDGAYVLDGILDAKCTATFTGFKLRPASTITICK